MRVVVVIEGVVVGAVVPVVMDEEVVVVVAGSPLVESQTAVPTSTTAVPPRSQRMTFDGRAAPLSR
jgi:hypothetical protein